MSRASELVLEEAATVELNIQVTVVEVGELDASTEGRPRRRIIVSEDDGSRACLRTLQMEDNSPTRPF